MTVIKDIFYDDFCFLCDVYGKLVESRTELSTWRSEFASKWMCEVLNLSNRYKQNLVYKFQHRLGNIDCSIEGDMVASMIVQYYGDEEFDFSFMDALVEMVNKRERHIEQSAAYRESTWFVESKRSEWVKFNDGKDGNIDVMEDQIDMYTFPSTYKDLPAPLHNTFETSDRGGKKRHRKKYGYSRFMRRVWKM